MAEATKNTSVEATNPTTSVVKKAIGALITPRPELMKGNICVFASARAISEDLVVQAYELGQTIAENNMGLVYGGFSGGLMGAVAMGVRERNGKVIGVVPGRNVDTALELRAEEGFDPFELNTETISAGTLENRKRIMLNRSDAVIAFPGGIGTFDELATTFMDNRTGTATRGASSRVALVNDHGFYQGINFTLDMMGYMGATNTGSEGYAYLADDAQDAFSHVSRLIEVANNVKSTTTTAAKTSGK